MLYIYPIDVAREGDTIRFKARIRIWIPPRHSLLRLLQSEMRQRCGWEGAAAKTTDKTEENVQAQRKEALGIKHTYVTRATSAALSQAEPSRGPQAELSQGPPTEQHGLVQLAFQPSSSSTSGQLNHYIRF